MAERASTIALKEARNAAVVARLRDGAETADIAFEFGLPDNTAKNLCVKLRRLHGIKVLPKAKSRARRIDKVYEAALSEVERHLGPAWVAGQLGPADGPLDDGQTLLVQQMHAALRVALLDAQPWQAIIAARFVELRRAALVDAMEHQSLKMPAPFGITRKQEQQSLIDSKRPKRGAKKATPKPSAERPNSSNSKALCGKTALAPSGPNEARRGDH